MEDMSIGEGAARAARETRGPLGLWAAALEAYRAAVEGEGEAAREALCLLAAKEAEARGADEAALAEALGLWCRSEVEARIGGLGTGEDEKADARTRRVAAAALEARAEWHGGGARGRHAVNLALAYAAVSSRRNAANSAVAAKELPALKAALFSHFMDSGRLRSRAGEEGVDADIVLCSVPFCIMDAGNQIMVETVERVERSRGRESDALLAWYYAERGDLARAERLADEVATRILAAGKAVVRDLLAEALSLLEPSFLLLARGSLARARAWTGESGRLVHRPEGDANRYRFQDRARVPLEPVGGETVVLRAQWRGRDPGARGFVEVSVGEARSTLPLRRIGLDGETARWEASLGVFRAGDEVAYRFVVESCEGRDETAFWRFRVGSREPVLAFLPGDVEGSFRLVTPSRPDGAAVVKVARRPDRVDLILEGSVMAPSADGARVGPALPSIALGPDGSLEFRSGGRILAASPAMGAHAGLSAMELDLDPEGKVRHMRLRLAARPGEDFVGTGERFASLSHRGRRLDSWVFNQYRDQGDRTYIPIPFYASSEGYGLRLGGGSHASFDFGARIPGVVELEADAGGLEPLAISFYPGRPHEALATYLAGTGLPALPPRWAFGPWMSSNNWDNQDLVLSECRRGEELGIPATVIVLEQWSDEATFYIWNDATYDRRPGGEAFSLGDFRFPPEGRWPDPRGMVGALHAAGLKVLLWQAPVMRYMDGIPHAQRDADEGHMVERGYCLARGDGSPYRIPDFEWFKRSLVPDFSNPAAADWWLSKRRYLVEEVGIDGFKTDGGECVYGPDTQDAAGRSGDCLRNAYPVTYVEAFHRFVREAKAGDAMTFSRAGFEGAQRVPAHWAGDERSTFAAYRASLRAGLSAGLSGLPFWGWDFAGFSGDVPGAELFCRAAAMAAFCPIMQYHAESKGERNRDRTPWNIAERSGDDRVIDIYRSFARARMNLLPYLWAEARRSAATGLPMMRALFAEFPEERLLRGLDDEYLLGEALLVAPILEEGAVTRRLVLPPGSWTPLWGGEALEGPRVLEVASPLDTLPVYLRADRLLALNLPEDLAFPGDVGSMVDGYRRLCLRIFLKDGLDGSYERYDGSSVRVRASRAVGGDGFEVLVENASGETVSLLVEDAKGRAVFTAPPGESGFRL